MHLVTDSLWFLPVMAFALGLRHGVDLDHLATIDAMTNVVKADARLSKWVGFLFSLGHGSVVILMSLVIGSGMIQVQSPLWLESLGRWISVFFLLVFGVMTLWNMRAGIVRSPTSVHRFVFQKWSTKPINSWFIICIGALFAISFDTFTQVALFSISATYGLFFIVVLGIFFMIGMMVSDGCNGLFVSIVIRMTDKKSDLISQGIGLLIACFSLILGLFGLLHQMGK